MGRALNRVLLVEDDPEDQVLTSLALGRLGGLTAEICSSGREAVERAAAFAPDMILLDVMMPGMDGPETLAALRLVPALREVPVVFLTARCQPHEIAQYRGMGCLDVIAKPFVPSALPETLHRLWARHAIRRGPAVAQASAEFHALKRAYLSQVPERVRALETVARAALEEGRASDLEDFRTLAHRLVGSAALYGLPSLSAAARALEGFAASLASEERTACPGRRAELDSLLKNLRARLPPAPR